MKHDRNWTVLFIGGASGTGKSTLAYDIARHYGVNVMEVDDVHLAIEKMTDKDAFPAIHYWNTGINWMDIGVEGNVKWLVDVSREIMPVLKALADRHVEDQVPIIIEGDFIHPGLMASFDTPEVKALFVQEAGQSRIVQNYASREGGEPQLYRAEISVAYGQWIAEACRPKGIPLLDIRPWDTALQRAIQVLKA